MKEILDEYGEAVLYIVVATTMITFMLCVLEVATMV